MSALMTRGDLNLKSRTHTSSLSCTLTFGGAGISLNPVVTWAAAIPPITITLTARSQRTRGAMDGPSFPARNCHCWKYTRRGETSKVEPADRVPGPWGDGETGGVVRCVRCSCLNG